MIEFANNESGGGTSPALPDLSGAKFVLIFKDQESTKFVGTVSASCVMP